MNTTVFEGLVCNCNLVWCSILPPPPCYIHMVQVQPDIIYKPYTVEELDKIIDLTSEDAWYRALAKTMGPQLMQELFEQLLGPFASD